VALKVVDLIDSVMADPFSGIGKPEPLRHLGPNTWSRRLTQEHRVVYLVSHNRIDFLQARYHY
jgi:toxin YoeB